MATKKLIVTEKNHGQRLDVFLSEALVTTRSQVEKLFAAGRVQMNSEPPKKAGERVKAGDQIVIARSEATKQPPEVQNQPGTPAGGSPRSFQSLAMTEPTIIAETPDYVVINKPSGLLVHPTQANEKNSLVAWLVKKYPKIKTVGDNPAIRPGIVHRLDKEASGLMVVAKTQAMFDLLKEQFKNRTVEKEYFALVHGRITKDWDEINFPIARGENTDRMAARPLSAAQGGLSYPEGFGRGKTPLIPKAERGIVDEDEVGIKEARTEFFVEKRFVNFTLLRVIIHTGRMHQIRAHMLAYNAPLVGDPLYFQKKQKRTWDERCGRLFLHSVKLAFTDLNGEKQTFESVLPPELEQFLTTLS